MKLGLAALLAVLFPSRIICSLVPADVANFLELKCGISVESMYEPIFASLSNYDNYPGNWYELIQKLLWSRAFEDFCVYRESVALKHSSKDKRCQVLLNILLDDYAILNILRARYFDILPLTSFRRISDPVFFLASVSRIRGMQMHLQRETFSRSGILEMKEIVTQIRDSLKVWMYSMEVLHSKPALRSVHQVVRQSTGHELEETVWNAHLKIIKHYEDILLYSPSIYSPELDIVDYWEFCPQLASLAGLPQNKFTCPDEISFKYAAASLIDVSATFPTALSSNNPVKKSLQKIGIMAFVVRTIVLENYILFYYQPKSVDQTKVLYSITALGMQVHAKLEAFCRS